MSIESGWCGLLCCLQLRRLRSTSARPDHPTVEADPTSRHGTSPRSHLSRSPMPGGEQRLCRRTFDRCPAHLAKVMWIGGELRSDC